MGLIIDNFAGGGGASTGIELALGRHVDIAINHDPQAIAMHKSNHPLTKHFTEDVFEIDPVKVCNGQEVDLCWLSPDCTHFSRAKGGVPVSKKIRGLAWIACKWAGTVKPKVIILENVQEFKTWGPLTKDGYPDKRKKGQTFHRFINTLESLGYSVDYRELVACDFGAPTSRKRFFLIARSDKKDIVWPTPSYSKDGKILPKWKSAASIIDWSISTKSIFDRKKPLSDATNKRIARGIVKFVLENPKPFFIDYHFDNQPTSIENPMKTITTVRGRYLCTPVISHIGQTGFKSDRNNSITTPLSTIVTKNETLLVTPSLIPMGYIDPEGKRTADLNNPLMTVTAGGNKFALASATLIQTGYGEAKGQAPRVPGLEKPIGTLVSSNKHALITAFLDRYFGGDQQKGTPASSPVPTVTTLPKFSLISLSIMKNYGGNYKGAGSDINNPLPTITSVDHNALLVCAFLDKYYGTGIGQDIKKPLGAVTSKDRFSLITLKVNGKEYVLSDIGMRMLNPRELYNAQGFPPDYIIDHDYQGNKITTTQQIAKCGNSVPPPFSEALVRANLPELAFQKKIQTMDELYKAKTTANIFASGGGKQ